MRNPLTAKTSSTGAARGQSSSAVRITAVVVFLHIQPRDLRTSVTIIAATIDLCALLKLVCYSEAE
jgi:hypothetical protein